MREFFKLDEWETWIPDFGDGERAAFADGDDSVITMELRFLTKDQRDSYSRTLQRSQKRTGSITQATIAATRQLFAENIRGVSNFRVGGVDIIDGEQVYNLNGFDKLHTQIVKAIYERSELESGLAKKLSSLSASSPAPAKPSASGDVVGATPESPRAIPAATMKAAI